MNIKAQSVYLRHMNYDNARHHVTLVPPMVARVMPRLHSAGIQQPNTSISPVSSTPSIASPPNGSGIVSRLVSAEVAIAVFTQPWHDTVFLVQPGVDLRCYDLHTRESLADTMDSFRSLFVECRKQANQK
jgi:hypothetical protein